jgi:hypothetical protein
MGVIIGPGITVGGGITVQGEPLGSASFTPSSYLQTTMTTPPGTGDFTMELWSYCLDFTDGASFSGWFDTRGSATDAAGFTLYVTSGAYLSLRIGGSLQNSGVANFGGMSLNNWYHLALVRSGTTFTVYVNGTANIVYNTTVRTLTNTNLYIGQTYDGFSFNGYLSNFRYVQGVAVYTGNFFPPTQPLSIAQASYSSGSTIAAVTSSQTDLLLNTPNNANFDKNSSIYTGFTVDNPGSPAVTASALTPF